MAKRLKHKDNLFRGYRNFSLEDISEQDAEKIGLLLSKNKSALIAACKGKPDLLLEIGSNSELDASNVTPLAAKA